MRFALKVKALLILFIFCITSISAHSGLIFKKRDSYLVNTITERFNSFWSPFGIFYPAPVEYKGPFFGDNLAVMLDSTPLTTWAPSGIRIASSVEQNNPVFPNSDHFITIHGSVRSTDEVNIVFAPVFEQSWNAEPNAFVTESPVFGADGSSYFAPASPTDNGQNVLIKVDTEGNREFAITQIDIGGVEVIQEPSGTVTTFDAAFGLSGSAIVLNSPELGKEVVYGAGYLKAYAVDEDGTVLWSTSIMPESIKQALDNSDQQQLNEELEKPHRVFGITYHPTIDAILIADISGDVTALDRVTGERLGGITMPGSPASGGDNDIFSLGNENAVLARLFEVAFELVDKTFEDDGIEFSLSSSDAQAALSAVLGGGAVIGNQISVDPNTNSLWVASTDLDSADDNPGDGLSEKGALYRIDLIRNQNAVDFSIECFESFDGGTTSTPSVSADGERVYTTDNFGSALAIDRDCNRVWTVDVGEAAVASLAVSSEVGAEIYYPTLTSIYKLQENIDRTSAEVVWAADLNSSFAGSDLFTAADVVSSSLRQSLEAILQEKGISLPDSGLSVGVQNIDLASIGQNGIMIHSGYGLSIPLSSTFSFQLPVALNVGLYDRETGEFINGTNALEENIGAMYTAPDGTVVLGSSPIRRAIIRSLVKAPDFILPELPRRLEKIADNIVDYLVKPLTGGITKYGFNRGYDLIARDATCQAAKRIKNTMNYEAFVNDLSGVDADRADAQRLIEQSQQAISLAVNAGELAQNTADEANAWLTLAFNALSQSSLAPAESHLNQACNVILAD